MTKKVNFPRKYDIRLKRLKRRTNPDFFKEKCISWLKFDDDIECAKPFIVHVYVSKLDKPPQHAAAVALKTGFFSNI